MKSVLEYIGGGDSYINNECFDNSYAIDSPPGLIYLDHNGCRMWLDLNGDIDFNEDHPIFRVLNEEPSIAFSTDVFVDPDDGENQYDVMIFKHGHIKLSIEYDKLIDILGFSTKSNLEPDECQTINFDVINQDSTSKILSNHKFISESTKYTKHMFKLIQKFILPFNDAVLTLLNSVKYDSYPIELDEFNEHFSLEGDDYYILMYSIEPSFSLEKLLKAYELIRATSFDKNINYAALNKAIGEMSIEAILSS